MIKAVIFDMFETLITHYESPLYMGKQMCADMGIPEPKFREIWNATEDDRTLGKRSVEDVVEEILRVNDRFSTELFETVIKKRKESKVECFHHMHPEIIPMLQTLREKGFSIGLITNCYFEERDAIRNSLLFGYFDGVCMSCELGLKKPDVDIFRKCTELLEVSPSQCIYVGDGGSYELETAEKLGMKPIQALWYLKEGVNPSVKRKNGVLHGESPMDICEEIYKMNNRPQC